MAANIFRASVSFYKPLFDSLCTRLSTKISVPKKLRLLSCASSELNPVQSRSELSFCVGTHLIPHPNKVDRGGEDALFVSNYNGGVIAIADGVSGWAEQNVDPSLFSRELMANASSFVEDEEVNYDPQILIQKAHAATSSVGSATIIVVMLERNGILKIASVGDCGLRIIRKGQIIFSSSPQEHYFDCPYQLSSEAVGQTYLDALDFDICIIPTSSKLLAIFTPKQVSTIEVVEGDIIVMGSDGLFDNVFDHEIVSAAARFSDVAEAAKVLANLAHSHSMDSNFDSPYSMEARAKGYGVPLWKKILGMKLTGGKLDDITVIVSQVVNSQDVPIP